MNTLTYEDANNASILLADFMLCDKPDYMLPDENRELLMQASDKFDRKAVGGALCAFLAIKQAIEEGYTNHPEQVVFTVMSAIQQGIYDADTLWREARIAKFMDEVDKL